MTEFVLLIALGFSIFLTVACGIFALMGVLILRANQKMYTEYFKDRSMAKRSEK